MVLSMRLSRIVPVVMVSMGLASAGACTEPGEESSYCADLADLVQVLDGGGSKAEYDQLLGDVVEASPPAHAKTWALFQTLSREPFDYANFNPAVDSLDDIADELDSTCPGLDRVIVDDDGRLRQLPEE
jgi:hypothetical protein